MSQLSYNGVSLGGITTNSVTRNVRLSDDSVDYMWTDFIIDVNFIYNSAVTSYPIPGVLPPTTDAAIRSILMQPRAPLFYSEGGIPILQTIGIDSEDGPIPLSLTISRIAGANLFYGRYVIKASIYECPIGSFISPIASGRYSRTESIDAQYRSTIITSGKVYFRSNVLVVAGVNADALRGTFVPQPLLGYQRKGIQVGLSSNGIVMEFTVIDVEVFIDLGSTDIPGSAGASGIIEMDLDFTTNTLHKAELGLAGYLVSATCSAMAVGSKFSDTWTMTQFLYQCVFSKLGFFTRNGICVDVSFRESVFKKVVSLSMTYQSLPPQPGNPPDMAIGLADVVGVEIDELPNTDGIEPQPPFSNATRGTAAFQLAVNAFATACLPISTGGCDQTGLTPPDIDYFGGQCTGPINIVTYETITTDQGDDLRVRGKESSRGENTNKTAYKNYTIKKDVVTDTGSVQVPYAKDSQSQGSLGNPPTSPPSQSPTSSSSQSPTSAVLQLFQPITTVSYKFSIERYGCVPEVPNPTATINGYTLLQAIRSPLGIEIGPDGYTPIYRITGSYIYASVYPVMETDTIPFDIPAWVNISPSTYTEIEPEDYIEGAIQNPPQV